MTTATAINFFEIAEAAFRRDDDRWIPCTEEHWEYCLGVLPPIYGPKGTGTFAVSEAFCESMTGTVYHWILENSKGEYFCRMASKADIAKEFDA